MKDLVHTFLLGSWDLLFKVFLIVVPIMIFLEMFEGTRPFRVLVHLWSRLVGRWLGMSEQAAAPTLIGFLFGIAYGGGVIVRDTHRRNLGRRQVFLMSVFLSMVHAIVEDTAVFVAAGASWVWIIWFRLFWAAAVTLAMGAGANLWIRQRRRN